MEALPDQGEFDFTDMDNSKGPKGDMPKENGGTVTDDSEPTKEEGAPAEDAPTEETPPPKADEEDETETQEAPAPKEEATPEVDAQALASIQRQRRRALDEIEAKRRDAIAEVADREARLRAREQALEGAEDIEKRIRYLAKNDPIGLLEKYGEYDEDSFEDVSKLSFAASKRGKNDPNLRAAASQSLRERTMQKRLDELERRETERNTRDQERAEQQALQAEAQKYLDRCAKAAPSEGLLGSLLKNDREEAYALFRRTALEILDETGEEPVEADVIKRAEEIQRAQLKKLGIDPDKLGQEPKSKTPEAVKSPAAKTLSNDLGTTTTPRAAPKSREEEIAAVARALEAGNLDDGF
jgi:hypothetical protein